MIDAGRPRARLRGDQSVSARLHRPAVARIAGDPIGDVVGVALEVVVDAVGAHDPPRTHVATRSTNRSLASVSADGHPGALAGERADHDADLVGGRGEVERSGRPARTRRSCPAAPGTAQPGVGQPGDAPARARRPVPSTRSSSSGSRSSEAIAAAWATPETPNGSETARSAPAQRRRPDGVPDPEAGQPVGLGEGAGEQHVLVAAVGRDAVDGVGHPDELDVRLVDDDQHVRRAPSARNASSSACVTAGPVGLLGVQTSTTRVRSVIAAAIASRSWRPSASTGTRTIARRGGGDRDRVGLEASARRRPPRRRARRTPAPAGRSAPPSRWPARARSVGTPSLSDSAA